MKVLHVIPSVSSRAGGPSQAILPLCASLITHGLEVLLASTDDGLPAYQTPGGPKRATITRYKNSPAIFFPAQLGASFKYSRPFASWLNQHVSDYDLVHIHAVFNHSSIVAARACRKHDVPYIIRPLGTLDPWSMKQKSFRKKVFLRAGVKTMLTGASAIHYTANGEQQAVESSLGLKRGAVVPLGVEPPHSPGIDAVTKLAAHFPELLDRPYVLTLSRLLPTKGIHVLLEAFVSLIRSKEFRAWRLVIGGEGPSEYVALLKRIVEDHDAKDSVVFAGWLEGEHKEAVLQNASLLGLPSSHENFGLCVMEALACGVPVLISPNVNLASEVESARAGWITGVEKELIERKLAEIFSSSEERLRRGQAGRNLAARFTWPEIAKQLVTVYSSIVPTRNAC
jgi:glycosyltransferase involved in cell wall biosynthesis